VFRAVHSTKGAAGFLGFERISDLSHELENLLNLQRTRELATSHRTTDAMLRAVDCLRGMLHDIEHSNDVDISSHVQELQALASRAGVLGSEDQPTAKQEPSMPVAREDLGETAPAGESSAAKSAASSSPAGGEQSIRVSVAILDRLMTLAGELVLGRNQVNSSAQHRRHVGIEAVASRLDQVTTELQEAIMRTRMQPIGAVFSKFPRVVRDLSAKLGKQCDVVMDGKEVDVDKTILEAIGDPLTHLVRNSIDHGVERPDVRVAAASRPSGTIHLKAYHEAGKVRIDIADDGGGIYPEKLKKKAVEKGVITAEQARAPHRSRSGTA
jgi:two-component system chemotaxis sensor kinase CheA